MFAAPREKVTFEAWTQREKAREMDVPLSRQRNALYQGLMRVSAGRNTMEGSLLRTALAFKQRVTYQGDKALREKTGVHLELEEIFRVGTRDCRAG